MSDIESESDQKHLNELSKMLQIPIKDLVERIDKS